MRLMSVLNGITSATFGSELLRMALPLLPHDTLHGILQLHTYLKLKKQNVLMLTGTLPSLLFRLSLDGEGGAAAFHRMCDGMGKTVRGGGQCQRASGNFRCDELGHRLSSFGMRRATCLVELAHSTGASRRCQPLPLPSSRPVLTVTGSCSSRRAAATTDGGRGPSTNAGNMSSCRI